MADVNKTVFISYRRSGSSAWARLVYQDLCTHGYDVFMDVESIGSGTFDSIIMSQIEARAHFVLILAPGSLDECKEPDDWLRREIEAAMRLKRNIVPILVGGFQVDDVRNYPTGELAGLPKYNGLAVSHHLFDEAMERLRTRFLCQPAPGGIVPSPPKNQAGMQGKIAEVIAGFFPSPAELTAEQWFDQAFSKRYAPHEAITDYTNAIRLRPDYVDAYLGRGAAHASLGEYEQAVADCAEAIALRPDYAEAYYTRGLAYFRRGKYEQVIADFTEVIRLKPHHAYAYNGRGAAYAHSGYHEQAILDYCEAIRLMPDFAIAHSNLREILLQLGLGKWWMSRQRLLQIGQEVVERVKRK